MMTVTAVDEYFQIYKSDFDDAKEASIHANEMMSQGYWVRID